MRRTTRVVAAKAISVIRRRLRSERNPGSLGSDAAARLAALTEIVRVVGSAKDYDALLLDAARAARMALGGAAVSISRWERGQGQVRVLVNEGDLAEGEVERPVDDTYSVRRDQTLTDLIVEGRGFVMDVSEPNDVHWEALLVESGKGSAVDVPLVVEGQVWGALWVTRAIGQEPFTESDREYLLQSSQFLLDPRRLTVALSRAKRKMVLVASRSIFSLFSPDEETFANALLWKNLLLRTYTTLLWDGDRDGTPVELRGGQ